MSKAQVSGVRQGLALAFVAAVLAASACKRHDTLPRITQVPEFSLHDQDGRTLGRSAFRGKIWIADFVFTRCPDVCPLLTAKMVGMRQRLVADRAFVRYVSFSVDPEHDTPAVLKQYAIEHGADRDDWSFLTGPVDDLTNVIVNGFREALARVPSQAGKAPAILHGSHFVLVDRDLEIRGYYSADEAGMVRLMRDARILLAEKKS